MLAGAHLLRGRTLFWLGHWTGFWRFPSSPWLCNGLWFKANHLISLCRSCSFVKLKYGANNTSFVLSVLHSKLFRAGVVFLYVHTMEPLGTKVIQIVTKLLNHWLIQITKSPTEELLNHCLSMLLALWCTADCCWSPIYSQPRTQRRRNEFWGHKAQCQPR